MRHYLLIAALALSFSAQATNNHNNDGCRGNCAQPTGGDATAVSGSVADADANAAALAVADVDVGIKNSNTNVIGVGVDVSNKDYNTNLNDNRDYNSNTNVAYGGKGGDGGNAYASGGDAYAKGGSAEQDQRQSQRQDQSQGQSQGQSSFNANDNSNSSNNSASQSTNVTFQGSGEATHYNKYGNNVNAIAPAIYSSSACTAGGVSAGAAGMGFGVSVGGAKQDPQCQVRENARILAGLDPALAIAYLCQNEKVDIGAVLGAACKYVAPPQPPVVLPEPTPPQPPVEVIHDDVKGK